MYFDWKKHNISYDFINECLSKGLWSDVNDLQMYLSAYDVIDQKVVAEKLANLHRKIKSVTLNEYVPSSTHRFLRDTMDAPVSHITENTRPALDATFHDRPAYFSEPSGSFGGAGASSSWDSGSSCDSSCSFGD